MKFDPQKHHRASSRLRDFDYSFAGAYFITVVAYRREMLFGEIVNGELKINRRGEIVREEWFASANIRKEIRLFEDEFVLMPNHIHGIVWIVDDDSRFVVGANHPVANGRTKLLHTVGADGRPPLRRKPRSLGSFVAGFKSSVTKRIRDELNETGIWQRNYHDRIIRNDKELSAIREYIESNPMNWSEDEGNKLWGNKMGNTNHKYCLSFIVKSGKGKPHAHYPSRFRQQVEARNFARKTNVSRTLY